jgi:hypothetical protein
MRLAFILASLLFFGATAHAQCPDLSLSELQGIQRSDGSERETAIEATGFDLSTETSASRRYNRCWRSTEPDGKVLYDQALLWNKKTGHSTFLLTNKKAFLRLRQEIEGRSGGSTYTKEQSEIYVGQKFRYEFFLQNMDGLEYYAVKVSLK